MLVVCSASVSRALAWSIWSVDSSGTEVMSPRLTVKSVVSRVAVEAGTLRRLPPRLAPDFALFTVMADEKLAWLDAERAESKSTNSHR